MHHRLQQGEEDLERYRSKYNELSTEKSAWERVEKQMKEKVLKLQQDYYQLQLRQ